MVVTVYDYHEEDETQPLEPPPQLDPEGSSSLKSAEEEGTIQVWIYTSPFIPAFRIQIQ